jgi:hypothetical protein
MAEGRIGAPDPVLVQLRDWARAGGLTREALARKLEIARPTVAGWFLDLEAAERGGAPPRSARHFRFTNQRPEVRQKISEVLGKPVEQLRAESLGAQSESPKAVGDASIVVGSQVWNSAESMLNDLALGGLGRSSVLDVTAKRRLWHRVAEAVDGIEGVAATSIVAVPRGSRSRTAFQYQVVVLVMPPPDDAGEEDRLAYLRRIRDGIDDALADAKLVCRWEHGIQHPKVGVRTHGVDLLPLGSLVCPVISGSRSPRTDLLLPRSRRNPGTRSLRIAALVTNPYGGSGPIGGALAQALGAGHLRDSEAIRSVRAAHAGPGAAARGERGAFLTDAAMRDAAFILRQVLRLLELADMPGAWFLSMDAAHLTDFAPLRQALSQLRDVVVAVRMSMQWRRMAAWRLATAELNSTAHNEAPGVPDRKQSSDWFPLVPGTAPSARHLKVLREQARRAEVWTQRLQHGEDAIEELVKLRSECPDRPTITVSLDQLPDDSLCLRFDGGEYQLVRGDDRFDGSVIFADSVDGFMDCWTDAAVEIFDRLAELMGHDAEERAALAASLIDGPLAATLRARARSRS